MPLLTFDFPAKNAGKNFFGIAKANGRAAIRHSPVLIFCYLIQETRLVQLRRANLKTEKQEELQLKQRFGF